MPGTRQVVVPADDGEAALAQVVPERAFYESLGYAEIRDFGPGALRAFVRFDG